MPQQRRYYGGYGGYYDQSSEDYDPYSRWGNVGLTIRNTINKIIARKKEEQERAKAEALQKWQQSIEERKVAAEELRSQPKPIVPDVPALWQEALLAAGGDPVAAQEIMRNKLNPPKESFEDWKKKKEAEAEIEARYRREPITPWSQTTAAGQVDFLRQGITDLEYRSGELQKIYAAINAAYQANKKGATIEDGREVTYAEKLAETGKRIAAVKAALNKLRGLQGIILNTKRELPPLEFNKGLSIISNMELTEQKPGHWETGGYNRPTGNLPVTPPPPGFPSFEEKKRQYPTLTREQYETAKAKYLASVK